MSARLNIPTVDANSAPSQAGAPVINIHRLADLFFYLYVCEMRVVFPSSVDHIQKRKLFHISYGKHVPPPQDI